MIQMKGAVIDTSNSAAFGNILDYKSAGNYEYNILTAIAGNIFSLKYIIERSYEIPAGKVQLVTVPQFQDYTVNDTITALPWNGSKGGIVVMGVASTLTLNGTIDVAGQGFRGGQPNLSTIVNCNLTDYFYPLANNDGAEKGEGITIVSADKNYGRGALANGGGGGNANQCGRGRRQQCQHRRLGWQSAHVGRLPESYYPGFGRQGWQNSWL